MHGSCLTWLALGTTRLGPEGIIFLGLSSTTHALQGTQSSHVPLADIWEWLTTYWPHHHTTASRWVLESWVLSIEQQAGWNEAEAGPRMKQLMEEVCYIFVNLLIAIMTRDPHHLRVPTHWIGILTSLC